LKIKGWLLDQFSLCWFSEGIKSIKMRQIKFNIDRNTTWLVTLTITDETLFNNSIEEYLQEEEHIDWWDWEDIDGCELHIGEPQEVGVEYVEDYYDQMKDNDIRYEREEEEE